MMVLTGCSSLGIGGDEPTKIGCPRTAILGDAEKITIFKPGDGRDLIDVLFEAEITELVSQCRNLEGRIVSDLAFNLIATRGPAATRREGTFRFFVVVSDATGRVLAKESFSSRIAFEENRRRAGIREEIEQNIPLAANASGTDYEVLVGFQLTPDQYEFNRRR